MACGGAGAEVDCEAVAGIVTVRNVVREDVVGGEEELKMGGEAMEGAIVEAAVSVGAFTGVEAVAVDAGVVGSPGGHGTVDPPMYVCPFRTAPPKVIPAEVTQTGPFG